MAIGERELALLISLIEQGHISKGASVIELGAQQCSNGFLRAEDKLQKMTKLLNVSEPNPLPPAPDASLTKGIEPLNASAPASSLFWQWLGFCYKSIDLDESHNSDFIDLNYDDVPVDEKNKYQIVTNFGTTEHVANQQNAFKIIHDLTAVGGVMLHMVPTQGMINHGLINYNPKFFWMLARSNQYEWLFIDYINTCFYQKLPQNVIDHVKDYSFDITERAKRYHSADAGLFVAFKKSTDTPFVPPLDVCTGTKTDNPILKKRYWSVFT